MRSPISPNRAADFVRFIRTMRGGIKKSNIWIYSNTYKCSRTIKVSGFNPAFEKVVNYITAHQIPHQKRFSHYNPGQQTGIIVNVPTDFYMKDVK